MLIRCIDNSPSLDDLMDPALTCGRVYNVITYGLSDSVAFNNSRLLVRDDANLWGFYNSSRFVLVSEERVRRLESIGI